jgi:hypothetical protein
MTTHPLPSWRPQSPSPDFAARAVAAILRDRNLHREKRRPHRGVPIVATAALLLAGGAWAWTALPRDAKPPLHAEGRPAAPTSPETREVHAAASTLDPAPEVPRKPPAPPALASPRRREAPASSPDAGRRVILPRCNCQEAICDCLEQH